MCTCKGVRYLTNCFGSTKLASSSYSYKWTNVPTLLVYLSHDCRSLKKVGYTNIRYVFINKKLFMKQNTLNKHIQHVIIYSWFSQYSHYILT